MQFWKHKRSPSNFKTFKFTWERETFAYVVGAWAFHLDHVFWGAGWGESDFLQKYCGQVCCVFISANNIFKVHQIKKN